MNFNFGRHRLTAVAVILLLKNSYSASLPAVSSSYTVGSPLSTASHQSNNVLTTEDTVKPYHVPDFTMNELLDGSKDDQLKEVLSSTGLLAVRIAVNDPSHSNHNLLQGLCDCSANANEQGHSRSFSSIANGDDFLLADGRTVRRTIATATLGTDRPLPLPKEDIIHQCHRHGDNDNNALKKYKDLEQARDYVSQVASGAFLPALDRLIQDSRPNHEDRQEHILLTSKNGQHYSTVSSVVKDAVNLEHFHAYSHFSRSSSETSTTYKDVQGDLEGQNKSSHNHHHHRQFKTTAALDWHTDGGLFLAFLPGKICREKGNNLNNSEVDASFRIKVPHSNQKDHPVIFPSSSSHQDEIIVAIMLGSGAEHWIHTHPSLPLKATKHAVVMQDYSQTRVWYGMMHLVPTDAIVDDGKNVTFGELKRTSSTHSRSRRFGDDDSLPKDTVVFGCGTGENSGAIQMPELSAAAPSSLTSSAYRRRRLQHVGGQEDCKGANNFFCWLSCLDIPSDDDDASVQELVDDGKSLYCLDPSILSATQDIQLAVDACSDIITNEAGGVMNEACGNYWHDTVDGVQSYTDVFRTTDKEKIDLYDQKYCYGATSMYMQGFEWEGTTCVVYLFSPWVITTRAAMCGACIGTIFFGILTEFVIRQRRSILGKIKRGGRKLAWSALLYGVQLSLGYLLMLVVMTYSGPLVVSVVLGLVLGHVLWNWTDVMDKDGSGEVVLDGSTPCCQNIIEENNEEDFKVQKAVRSYNSTDDSSDQNDTTGTCCA